jgi:hypothetical protein
MGKPQTLQVEASHEGINEADRVLLADVAIESFREQCHLIPAHPFNRLIWRLLVDRLKDTIYHIQHHTFHTDSRWSRPGQLGEFG